MRLDVATNNTAITADDSHWLEFLDPDTTVMHSPVVQDQFDRFYWASPSTVPRYNTYDRIIANEHDWILGVPASGCPVGVQVSGGGDTMQIGNVTVREEDAGQVDYRTGNAIFLTPVVLSGSMLTQSVSFISGTTDSSLTYEAVVYSDLNGTPHPQFVTTGGPRAASFVGPTGVGAMATGMASRTPSAKLNLNCQPSGQVLGGRFFPDRSCEMPNNCSQPHSNRCASVASMSPAGP
jgi:hypothetical protein